jgi:AraC-like DNA-binding protein
MNGQATNLLDSLVMPLNDKVLTLNEKLVVMDSIDCNPTAITDGKCQFPIKPEATCILIVIKGMVRVDMISRDFIVGENDCIVIPKGTIIQHAEHEDCTQSILLAVSQYNLPAFGTHGLNDRQTTLYHLMPDHVRMLMTSYETLRSILSNPLFANNRESLAFNCIDLMGNIIVLGEDNGPEQASKVSRRDEIVARFLECVNQNYRERRELSFYAEQLQLSLKYMSHVIYEQTGRHPSAWIRDHVILDAKAMLRSGQYTVQQVAAELNFPNQSFFGKYFKEAVGISPKKWITNS